MKSPTGKRISNKPKRSLLVTYPHEYAKTCKNVIYPHMVPSAGITTICLDSVFSHEGGALVESVISDDLDKNGLVVLILKEEDLDASAYEQISALANQGFDIVSIVCGGSISLSEPYLDETLDPATGVFIIRTRPTWLSRFLATLKWSYGRPLGLISLDTKHVVDAALSLYPWLTDEQALCHDRFEDELTTFTQRIAGDITPWGDAQHVFVTITSIDITLDQFERLGNVLRQHFPSTTKFGIQLGDDRRCAAGTILLSALIFYRPSQNDLTQSGLLH